MMLNRYALISVLTFAVLMLATGCGNSSTDTQGKSQVSAKDVERTVEEAIETTQDFTENKFDEYSRTIETKFNILQKKHAELTARAKQAGAEANVELHEALNEIEKKKEAIQKKVEELKSASGNAWKDLKAGIDRSLKELEESYEMALARFSRE